MRCYAAQESAGFPIFGLPILAERATRATQRAFSLSANFFRLTSAYAADALVISNDTACLRFEQHLGLHFGHSPLSNQNHSLRFYKLAGLQPVQINSAGKVLRIEREGMHARGPVLVAQQSGHFLAGEIENLERHYLRRRQREGDLR